MNNRTKKILTVVGIIVLALAVVFVVGGPNFTAAAGAFLTSLPGMIINMPATLVQFLSGSLYLPTP